MADEPTEALVREQKSKIVPMSEENIAVCRRFCGTCPTHDECREEELLFCSGGESEFQEVVTQRGCNCPECDVWMEYGLSSMYFCINGEA